jgi:hypothetical protein
MRRFLPSWWKTALLATGLLLLAVLVFRAGAPKPKQHHSAAALPEDSNPAQGASALKRGEALPSLQAHEPPPTHHAPALAKPTAPNANPPTPASGALEDRRRMLNQRREFAQELMRQSPEDLLSRLRALWGSANQSGRLEKKSAVIGALTTVLRGQDKQSNDAAIQQMGAWLRDTSLSSSIRSEVASILGAIQTPQSVQLLFGEYQQANNEQIREVLAREIAKTGDDRWAARFHEDLSPALETAWPAAKDDPNLAQAVALALAKVGTPSGVTLLLGEVAGSATTVEGLSELTQPSARAAASALDTVRNPNVVPVLAAGLLGPDTSAVQQYICGSTLAAMGNADATRTLLKWASTAPDSGATWASNWFDKLRDTASFQLVEAATSATGQVPFSSAAVRNAVALGLRNR